MSVTQTFIGSGVVGGALYVLTGAIIPAPPAIVVHALEYRDGMIIQDRTVNSDVPFYAAWAARIEDDAGQTVCAGSGAWAYEPGRLAIDLPLTEWVGDPDCTLSPGVTYHPVGVWSWGDEQASFEGPRFTP